MLDLFWRLHAALHAALRRRRRDKFFYEAKGKYDARYFTGEVATTQSVPLLMEMLAAFMDLAGRARIKPIVAHGTLIGWWWSRRLLPWDDDIDLLVTYSDLRKLRIRHGHLLGGRYLLEVNPNHVFWKTLNPTHLVNDEPNRIDARFIDTRNGLYIDITAVRQMSGGLLRTKCPHQFAASAIFPVRPAELQGIPVFVPADVEAVLRQEYGDEVLTATTFNGHRVDASDLTWKRIEE